MTPRDVFNDNIPVVEEGLRRAPKVFVNGWPKPSLSHAALAPVAEKMSIARFEFCRMRLKGGEVIVLGRNTAENDGTRMADWVRVG